MSVLRLLGRPWLLRSLVREVRLAARLLREPLVPLFAKAVPVAAALYLISPVDALPDVFPLLGQLDDVAVVFVALKTFVLLCPPAAAAFHRDAMAKRRSYSPIPKGDYVIDADYHVRS